MPEAGIFDGALLVAEVYVGEAVSLRAAIGPFEVIHQGPGVIGAHFSSICNCACQFDQMLAMEGGVKSACAVSGVQASGVLCGLTMFLFFAFDFSSTTTKRGRS